MPYGGIHCVLSRFQGDGGWISHWQQCDWILSSRAGGHSLTFIGRKKGDCCSLTLPQSTGVGVAAAAEVEPCLAASLLRCQGREPVLPDMLRKGQNMQIIG